MFLAVFAGWSHVSSRLMSELSPSSVLPDRLLGRGPWAWCPSGSAWVPSCWARWQVIFLLLSLGLVCLVALLHGGHCGFSVGSGGQRVPTSLDKEAPPELARASPPWVFPCELWSGWGEGPSLLP